MAEQKAAQDADNNELTVKERVEAAKRTDKEAKAFFSMSSDDIKNMEAS